MQKDNTYLILLVDRIHARILVMQNGLVKQDKSLVNDEVPQKVKHGDNTWDSSDKIFRHIEDHLHRHLTHVGESAALFARKNHIKRIIIGSHKPLFSKIEKHLPYPYVGRVKGKFITELKMPFGEICKRAKQLIGKIEKEDSYAKLEKYFTS